MKLKFSRASLNDLVRLRDFIAQHNTSAAQRISKRLRGAIKGLVDMPQIGRPVKEMPGELRELIFGRYVVRYEVRRNILYILRIWHGKKHRSEPLRSGHAIMLEKNRGRVLISAFMPMCQCKPHGI